MYRTNDPRFRRRLDHIGQTLESANETAQSGLYIFGRRYIRPCFESIGSCLTTCVDAGCPSLNLRNRDRLRRQRGRGRSRGRAELSFDFYDDWDEDENDSLLGWGDDQFNSLLGNSGGYGTLSSTQPARQRGMSYPKVRRKSTVQDVADDPNVIPTTSFFGKLFGGKALRYKPSAAGLQEHPGTRRLRKDGTIPEGEALLEDSEVSDGDGLGKHHRRTRSGTQSSGATADSLSSRGDIFPSDEELDDAIPLDDEFAMVLERRTTQSGGLSGPETESSSGRTRSSADRKRGKRPSAGSRTSTRRTMSSRSTRSSTGKKSASRRNSSVPQTPNDEAPPIEEVEEEPAVVPTLAELEQEERRLEQEEDEAVERKRQEARKVTAERGVPASIEHAESEEATPQASSPVTIPAERHDEPSQLPTPLATDDEEENALANAPSQQDDAEQKR